MFSSEILPFLDHWQTLLGSILGGIFALGVALVVAHSARRREEIASGILVVGNLVEVRAADEALRDLAKKNNVPEKEYPLWVSDKLVSTRPTLSPLFEASMTRIMPLGDYLAAHLALFYKTYLHFQVAIERLSQDFEHSREHGKALRPKEHLLADANIAARNFSLAVKHASCAEKLIADLIFSHVPTWKRFRRFAWPTPEEKACIQQLGDVDAGEAPKKAQFITGAPPKWGTDEITKFLDTARVNAYATFANLKAEYGRIVQIDSAIRQLANNLNHSEDWFAGFFVLTAHSSWLAAVNLSMSAQVSETYVMLRASLESGLYGLHIAKNPNLHETWLRRSDSPTHKSQMLEEFKFRNLINTLSKEDANEGRAAETLYNQCIDQGAHPNEQGLMQNLTMQEGAENINFQFKYMNPDPLALGLALKSTARVGVCVLGIFSHVYKTRYDLLGLSELLPSLRQGL